MADQHEIGPDEVEDEPQRDDEPDDSDDGGGEGSPEGPDKPEEPEEVAAQKPPPRPSERDDLARMRADLDRRQAELDARDRYERQTQERSDQVNEQQLMDQMQPHEKAMYVMAKQIKALEGKLNNSNASSFDQVDRQAFEKYAQDKRFSKYAADVERGYQELRKQGTQISRVAVLDYLLGKAVRERGSTEVSQQRQRGAERVSSARGPSGSTMRGNAPATGPRGRRSTVDRAESEDWAI